MILSVGWIRLLVVIMLLVAIGGPVGDARTAASPVHLLNQSPADLRQGTISIEQYLPGSLPLPSATCFRIEGSEVFDFATLVSRFPGVPDAASTLQALKWRDGANRQFACDTPPSGSVGWVDMSVHRFADARSAEAAVPFFATSRALGTTLAPTTAADLGGVNAALTGDAGNGMEYTLYATQGPLLFRVTGVAPVGNPRADVELVAAGLVIGSMILGEPESALSLPQTTGAQYSILDLGTGYGNWGSAQLINNQGDVVLTTGSANYADSNLFPDRITDSRVYLWRNGETIDLTSVGLGYATALNDNGEVLASNGRLNLVLDTVTMEPAFVTGLESNGYPADINDAGTVVGNVDGVTILASPGNQIPIPMPDGYGLMLASTVNDANEVVGVVIPGPGDDASQRGFFYRDGLVTLLGTAPGATSSRLNDLNDTGQAVGGPGVRGMHSILQYGRGFSFDTRTGAMSDLGTLTGYQNSNAFAINNQGQAVGIAWLPMDDTDVIRRAVVFDTRTNSVIDLNLALQQGNGWWLSDAYDINDAGQIVGRGYLNGESHAYLLTPQSP